MKSKSNPLTASKSHANSKTSSQHLSMLKTPKTLFWQTKAAK